MTSQTSMNDLKFVNIEDGVPQRAITSIIKDSDGLMWMGTNGVGLYKYNSSDITAYKKIETDSTTLSSSLVYCLFRDSANRIWVGTEAGLNLYNSRLDNFIQIPLSSDTKNETDAYPIFSIQESHDGDILVGTNEYGLFKLNPENFQNTQIHFDHGLQSEDVVINSMIPFGSDHMLVGTNQGLFTYDGVNKLLKITTIPTKNGVEQFKEPIETLMYDAKGNLWIGTFYRGLIRVQFDIDNIAEIDRYRFTDKRVLSMISGPDNTIFCGTENDGLFVLNLDGEALANYKYNKADPKSIQSNSIWSLYADQQNRIWIGYYNKGVGIYDKYYDKFMDIESLSSVKNSLQSPSVTGIVQLDQNNFWIGLDGGGVDIYNPDRNKFIHLMDEGNPIASGLENYDVQTIFVDSQNNIWVGTWSSGIYCLPHRSSKFIHYNTENTNGGLMSNSVTTFAEDSKGTIWIGTFFNGLHSFDPNTKKITSHSTKPFKETIIGQGHIRKVIVDKHDRIWLGTMKGIIRVTKEDDDHFIVENLNSILSNPTKNSSTAIVLSMYIDRNENLWIGTDGGGLCRYNMLTKESNWFRKSEGLVQEAISAIIADRNDNIWVSGEAGISMLQIDTNTITNYNTDDGLLASNFNYNAVTIDSNGLIYFGNSEGINYFDPETILLNSVEPKLYFSDFRLFNKSVDPSKPGAPIKQVISKLKTLTLDHNQSVFTIEYMGINYTRAKNNEYAYYLEGFEEDFNYVGNTRTATYTNLSPGDYVFHVKAANNDGVWSDQALSLPIVIKPAWWASKLAIISYILLVLLISYIIYKYVDERLKEKRMIKSEREKREQEEILNEKKIQFFTNISHEFRTPLTLILNPLNDILDNDKNKLHHSLKQKHKIILRNANRLKTLVDELMDFRKLYWNKLSLNISQINATKFVKEIAGHFKEEAYERNILFSTETDGSPLEFWGDPGMLEKVVFNLLSNAFKATPENGVITIGIFKCKELIDFPLIENDDLLPALEISIEDTGNGISDEDIEHIFERFYQAKDNNQQYYGGSGTGIGLEVVQSFVNLHKGKIEVESTKGVGTKFRLLFPFGHDHLSSKDSEETKIKELISAKRDKPVQNIYESTSASALNLEDLQEKNKDKRTILVVEDNSELRHYLKIKLKSEYIVVEAENGKKGLEMAANGIPDIIITDIIMPEMDGFEFCSLIKKDIKTSHIPVIMLTAKIMDDDKVIGIDSGADAYLNKPFEMKLLKSYIKRLIESRQQFLEKNIHDQNKITLLENTTSIDKTFMQKVLAYINDNLDKGDLNVEHLADDMSLSRSQLYRKIKAITGLTANELIRKIRLEKAKNLIENGSESIREVSFSVGFSSPSYFSKCFKDEFGILPTELKPNY